MVGAPPPIRDERTATRQIALAVLAATLGWATVLFSLALWLLRWRVVHEPGAGSAPEFTAMAAGALGVGALAWLAGQARILLGGHGFRWVALVWGLSLALTMGAALLSPLLLLLLV